MSHWKLARAGGFTGWRWCCHRVRGWSNLGVGRWQPPLVEGSQLVILSDFVSIIMHTSPETKTRTNCWPRSEFYHCCVRRASHLISPPRCGYRSSQDFFTIQAIDVYLFQVWYLSELRSTGCCVRCSQKVLDCDFVYRESLVFCQGKEVQMQDPNVNAHANVSNVFLRINQ